MPSLKVVTSAQMRRIEVRSGEAGVSTDTLMENAGLEVARRVRHQTAGHRGQLTIKRLQAPGETE